MQIEISESTYRAIAATHGDVSVFLEKAAQQALKEDRPATKPRFNANELLSEFRGIEGLFGEASLEDILSDRRCGIE